LIRFTRVDAFNRTNSHTRIVPHTDS
jgi:hypothetical protein